MGSGIGTVQGLVEVHGGTVSPGLPPGRLVIRGDLHIGEQAGNGAGNGSWFDQVQFVDAGGGSGQGWASSAMAAALACTWRQPCGNPRRRC